MRHKNERQVEANAVSPRSAVALHLQSTSAGVKQRCNPRPRRCECIDNQRIDFTMKHRKPTERMTIAALAAVATINWLLLTVVAPTASLI